MEQQITWDLQDRLRKALTVGRVSREEMAEALGVSPPTISRYLRGSIVPKRGDLTVWALKCGVAFEWLRGDGGGPEPLQDTEVKSRCSVQVRASDLDLSGAAQREEATGRVLATSAA